MIRNLSFSYNQLISENIFTGISLDIPYGKITAIVGSSGSGKTTLLKLILKYYDFTGNITVGDNDLKDLDPNFWRSQCGCVFQDGYVFSDTIQNNIIQNEDKFNMKRLLEVVRVTNLYSFIHALPQGFNTKIGSDGLGLSQGQKQRILIARALYNDPPFLLFDEATNALDAENEKQIIHNLTPIFKNKTVIIVAHRLSTVQNSDQIIVLEQGQVRECGNHMKLVSQKGRYFELIRNQLELGK